MGGHAQRQGVDRKEFGEMNHIAEVCAELALYHVMIGIDEILEHYGTEASLQEMEAQLWKFLEGIQSSEAMKK